MALSVNTNVMSLNAQRNLSRTQTGLATAMERLSSGLRVNSAKDDAAGLAIANRMDAQIRGMNVAIRNAGDAISLAQTAEGGLNEITNMLQRMRELAVQSANATNSVSDRLNLDAEYQQLNTEITRQVGATRFNGVAIIGGGAGANVFQVGADATDTITCNHYNDGCGCARYWYHHRRTRYSRDWPCRYGAGPGNHQPCNLRCGAEPFSVCHQQPAGGLREPGRSP